ncbi:amidase [Colletotrichum kahawae]|uniref:Amidase n=1 Tax=Colletotrichum kahawae TaxID=34407 RepID=A0AAE0D0V7_COLKA|nr:amidase [Colletotrichum kahawae]
MTATEVRRLIDTGEETLERYVSSLLERYQERDRDIRAWAHIEPNRALRQARFLDRIPREQRGPLHGFVIGVKDAILTEEFPTRHGSPIHANDAPLCDAASVAVLRRNGALILGKTTTTEFTATFEGPGTRNPCDTSRTPGGSSSGSAAAVADMQVPIALCTQTVGSTIRPASFTGVYAFKPTWNAISPEGQRLSSSTLDTFAVMARSVADLQQVGKALGLRDDQPPRQIPLNEASFAFVKSPVWQSAGPSTAAALQRAAKILMNAGAHVVEVTLPPEFDDILSLQNEILEAEIGVAFHKEYSTSRDQISDYLASIAQTAHTGSKKAYVRALDKIAALRPKIDEIADRYTAIVTPSPIDVAPKGTGTGSSDFNAMWTALHTPVINVPGFKGEDDMPVGLSLVTSRFRDEHLLQVARQVGGLFVAKGGDI